MSQNGSGGVWFRRYYERGSLVLDTLKSKAFLGENDLRLSEHEFSTLYLLLQREGEFLTFEDLYKAVWEPPDGADRRAAAREGLKQLCRLLCSGDTDRPRIYISSEGAYKLFVS